MAEYVLGIDQSTQGTKALLFDGAGSLLGRADLPHRQMIDARGWVEHDPEEIYQNTIDVVKHLVEKTGIDKNDIRPAAVPLFLGGEDRLDPPECGRRPGESRPGRAVLRDDRQLAGL